MSLRKLSLKIDKFLESPEYGTEEYQEWLQLDDVIGFLSTSTTGLIPAYVSMDNVYLYSVLVKESKLIGDYPQDIGGWNFGADSGWSYGIGYENEGISKRVFEPLDHTFSNVLDRAEPIFFLRYFSGYTENKSYVELDQKLAHLLQIHRMDERFAYSKIDEHGDFKDVVYLKKEEKGILCAVDLDELESYLFLTDTVLVRVFDFMRHHNWTGFPNDKRKTEKIVNRENELFAERTIVSIKKQRVAAWLRGFQIIRPHQPKEVLVALLQGKTIRPKYETFLAYDWKHNLVRECSCDPEKLGNYFVESDLPFSTSPAFFRPEVLLKYKQDYDKYEFGYRQIYCRGAWSVRYDLNEEGQVHVYLKEFAEIPYSEQIYWKSYNEPPKAGISKRAFAADFKAEWYEDSDPLETLKHTLRDFPKANHNGIPVNIWEPYLGMRSYSRLGYVVTDSFKEWQDHVLELAKLLIEGLQKPRLRQLAAHLQCDDSQLGTLKLLRACLLSRQINVESIEEMISPLEKLNALRQKAAHANSSPKHQNQRDDFRELVQDCSKSMTLLSDAIKHKLLDFQDMPVVNDKRR